MASLRFLLSQNARISSALSHCEIEYPASGSFSPQSSHFPFSPFTSPRISSAFLKAASKASHWPGRILPQMIRICIAIPPSGTRQGTSPVTTGHCPDALLVPVSAEKDYRQCGLQTSREIRWTRYVDRQAQHEGYECLD